MRSISARMSPTTVSARPHALSEAPKSPSSAVSRITETSLSIFTESGLSFALTWP